MMSSIRRQKGPYVNSVHYDESQTSRISSIYYELPEETSETEADMYDYSTSAPVDYEEPDNTSDTLPPEIPEREQHIAKPPTHPPPILHQGESDNEDEQDDIYDNNNTSTRCKLYTTLTHVHMPSIYSTPSHSMEFRTNTAVSDSMLDLNSEATITTPPPAVTHPDQNSHTLSANWNVKSSHRCRTKMVILMFLLVAVAIGMISLIVSVVAVFVTSRTTESTDSLNLTDMMELQEQVQLLQTEVEIMRNRTTGSVDISSFYDGCEKETKSNRCNPEEGFGIEFSCITECLDLEKMGYMTLDRTCYAIGAQNYPVTVSFRSSDNRHSVYCDCHVWEGNLITPLNISSTVICMMDMLRCPLNHTLNLTLDL